MANTQNLKPFKKGCRTSEEQVELARKAGKASGEARRRKRDMKKSFETLFAMQATDKRKKTYEKLGYDTEDLSIEEAITISMAEKAMAGDARMASLIMDVMGEKHSDKMKERELDLKEKQANDMKSEALNRLDSILEGLRDEAQAYTETE